MLDIPHQVLYGEQKLHIARLLSRRLQCDQKKCLCQYISLLIKDFRMHKIDKKFQILASMYGQITNDEFRQRHDKIDSIKTDHMLAADKRCRSFMAGSVEYGEYYNGN